MCRGQGEAEEEASDADAEEGNDTTYCIRYRILNSIIIMRAFSHFFIVQGQV